MQMHTFTTVHDAGAPAPSPPFPLPPHRSGNYTPSELLHVGFTMAQLREGSFTVQELRKAGYPAPELKRGGYTVSGTRTRTLPPQSKHGPLRTAPWLGGAAPSGCAVAVRPTTLTSVLHAAHLSTACPPSPPPLCVNYSAADLRVGGFTCHELREDKLCSMDELRQGGFTAEHLKRAGFNATDMRAGKFTCADLLAVEYTLNELRDGGFTCADFRNAGVKADRLREVGFVVDELRDGGFTYAPRTTAPQPVVCVESVCGI